MNILFVSNDRIPHIGGKSTHIIDLVEGLNSIGNNAQVISPTNIPKRTNVLIKYLLSPFWIINKNIYTLLYKEICNFVLSNIISKYCKKNKVDLISAQDVYAVYNCNKTAKKIGVPIVLTMHTYFGIEPFLDKKNINLNGMEIKRRIKKEIDALKYVKSVVAVDSRIQNHIKEVSSDYKFNIQVYSIMNFTNINRFYPIDVSLKQSLREKYNISNDMFTLVCSRRLVEKNGVIYALKAISKIRKTKNILFLLVGNGPQLNTILEYIKKENISDNVIILGDVENKFMHELYQLSDVSIVPSVTVNGLQEATSVSAIEAMACGLPVIASDIGGLKELIINNVNGCLVEEKNDEEIAEKIIDLMTYKLDRTIIGNNAQKYIADFHSNIIAAQKYLEVFNSSLNY